MYQKRSNHSLLPWQRLIPAHNRRTPVVRPLVLVSLLLLMTVGFDPTVSAQSSSAEPSPIALGFALPEGLDDPDQIDALAEQIGRMPAFVLWYEAWGGWSGARFGDAQRTRLEEIGERGITPLVSWSPWGAWYESDGGPKPVDPQPYHLRNIVAGDFDAYIDSWANGLADYGQPVFLSFAHEMNGDWFPWGVGVNGNTATDYIAAWRHVHDRFTALGVTNVRWVWTPNHDYGGPVSFEDVYPGDAYVDWVGVNGFNWGTSMYWAECQCQSSWMSFESLFSRSYVHLTSLTSKPIIITETASSEFGGDKAVWIVDGFLEQLPTRFPEVRAVAWYNVPDARTAAGGYVTEGEVAAYEIDWRINSSAAALDAFIRIASSSYLQGTLTLSDADDRSEVTAPPATSPSLTPPLPQTSMWARLRA